jgi:hypothetical protein
MKKETPFYLLLLPLFSLLHFYNDLFGFIPFDQMAFFLLLSYLLAGIIYAITYVFIRQRPVCSLIAFCALLLTLFFGPYHDFLKSITSGNVLSSYKIVLPASLLIFILTIYRFSKKPSALKKFSQYLNVMMTVFIVIESGKVIINVSKIIKNKNLIYSATPISKQYLSPNIPDSLKPDIYFLVFDAYTNNNTLKTVWNFNNDSITNWLSDKGFYVVSNGKANYDFTTFSISSTFNMNYIDLAKGNTGVSSSQALQAVRSMSNNETFSLLRKEDYSIHFFSPFDSQLGNNDLLHEFGDFATKKLYNHTLPKRIQHDILWNFKRLLPVQKKSTSAYNNYKKRVDDVHQTIKNILSTSNPDPARKPQFVYGHLMTTHQPHLFHADGTPRSDQEITATADNLFSTYTQQVIYTNKIIQELVAHILKNNKKNTIIIIEGDHGFREITDYNHQYNFPNFNAIYFFDKNYQQLYQSMSPVNTFRVFFNQYFNQNLPLLKDTSIKIDLLP